MPLKGEPRMGIQAGSKGSRTRKLSHRGQDGGTGIREALVVRLLHGARLPVGTDHRRGPVREKQVWAEPRPGKAGTGRMGVMPRGAGRACGSVPTRVQATLLHPQGAQLMARL